MKFPKAEKLMSGDEDTKTYAWEKNCRYKYEIGILLDILTEIKEDDNA